MTALTARTSAHRTLLAPPTTIERLLLGSSRALEAFAVTRMERRRSRAARPQDSVAAAAIERRRDVTAAAHSGLLPR